MASSSDDEMVDAIVAQRVCSVCNEFEGDTHLRRLEQCASCGEIVHPEVFFDKRHGRDASEFVLPVLRVPADSFGS